MDNGSEFISHKLDEWTKENNVELIFIQPGEPTQNAYIERLNGSIRRELLMPTYFVDLICLPIFFFRPPGHFVIDLAQSAKQNGCLALAFTGQISNFSLSDFEELG